MNYYTRIHAQQLVLCALFLLLFGINGQSQAPLTDTEEDVTQIILPGGGAFNSDASTGLGAIKITLPVAFTSSMIRMRLEVFDYGEDESFSILLAGQNLGSPGYTGWTKCTANLLTSSKVHFENVYFGQDANNAAIWIGDNDHQWGYLKVRILEVMIGHFAYDIATWDDGWNVGLDDTDFLNNGNNANVVTVKRLLPNWIKDGTAIVYDGGALRVEDYSPRILLKRNVSNGGYIQGIQSQLEDGTDNWFFGNSGEDLWTVRKGKHNSAPMFTLFNTGQVGIGLAAVPTDFKLAVDGDIIAEKIKVKPENEWPDYVFEKNYPLRSLTELSTYIQTHGHLPNIPSAQEVKEEGIFLGEMNALLLEKIEELTLHLIQKDQEMDALKNRMNKMEAILADLQINK